MQLRAPVVSLSKRAFRVVPARARQQVALTWHETGPVRRAAVIRVRRTWAVALSQPLSSPSRFERDFRPTAQTDEIERRLRQFARRLQRQRVARHAPRAVLLGLLVFLLLSVIGRLLGVSPLGLLGAVLGIGAALASLVVVARRRPGPFETAQQVDTTLGLRERIATAMELQERGALDGLAPWQVKDALLALEGVDPSQVFPWFPPGSAARQRALQVSGVGVLSLLGAVVLVLTPPMVTSSKPVAAGPGELLALADTGGQQEATFLSPQDVADPGAAVQARTGRPEDVGQATGLLGQPNPADASGQNGQSGRGQAGAQNKDAQMDAQDQTNGSVSDRSDALQYLGDALSRTQTGKQAGDALRRGDTQAASQQLSQMADQVKSLSPGARQSLSQALKQAATAIGEKDKTLADASQRAGQALEQFQNQEATQALRDAAKQVDATGQQVTQQKQLAERQQQLQKGDPSQLSSNQLGQLAQQEQQRAQQAQQQSQQMQAQGASAAQQSQAQRSRSEGDASQQGQSPQDNLQGTAQNVQSGQLSPDQLAAFEQALRENGLDGTAGQNGGTGAGNNAAGPPQLLNMNAQTVSVEAQAGAGPNKWAPPNPNSPPSSNTASSGGPATSNTPASTDAVGAGLDMNSVPRNLTDPVRQYFTPEQKQP